MARTDHYNDPDASRANSVVPFTIAVVTDDQDRIMAIRRRDNDLRVRSSRPLTGIPDRLSLSHCLGPCDVARETKGCRHVAVAIP